VSTTRITASSETLPFLVAMIRRRFNLAYSEALRPFRLTTRQYGVLTRLWAMGARGLTLDELAAALYTDQSSLSRVVDRMARTGLIARAVDPADRRALRITLTAKGAALARPIRRIAAHIDRRLTRALDAAELGRLAHDLHRLLKSMPPTRSATRRGR
jgi:MarR family transcriptional regulator for hemolysin